MNTTELLELIAQGKLKKALKFLVKYDYNEEIIAQSARFKRIEKDHNSGLLVNDSYYAELNKITLFLINYVKENFSKSDTTEQNDWKLDVLRIEYPILKWTIIANNKLPIMREFKNGVLDYRIIPHDKFNNPTNYKYPYDGEIGINFIESHDLNKFDMSIRIGLNLLLLGVMENFKIIIIYNGNSDFTIQSLQQEFKARFSSLIDSTTYIKIPELTFIVQK